MVVYLWARSWIGDNEVKRRNTGYERNGGINGRKGVIRNSKV
jgi:hypothetical protein